jgi:hypothetical protein
MRRYLLIQVSSEEYMARQYPIIPIFQTTTVDGEPISWYTDSSLGQMVPGILPCGEFSSIDDASISHHPDSSAR